MLSRRRLLPACPRRSRGVAVWIIALVGIMITSPLLALGPGAWWQPGPVLAQDAGSPTAEGAPAVTPGAGGDLLAAVASPAATLAPGSVIYKADWSQGLDGWVGSPAWKTVSGLLIYDASDPVAPGTRVPLVVAPYQMGTVTDYVVEAEIQIVREMRSPDGPEMCGGVGLVVRYETTVGPSGYIGEAFGCGNTLLDGSGIASITNLRTGESLAGAQFNPGADWHT